jgi:hypothetical protein
VAPWRFDDGYMGDLMMDDGANSSEVFCRYLFFFVFVFFRDTYNIENGTVIFQLGKCGAQNIWNLVHLFYVLYTTLNKQLCCVVYDFPFT